MKRALCQVILAFILGLVASAIKYINMVIILLGGGVALLYAARSLRHLQAANEDQRRGIQIIENALKVPFMWISPGVDLQAFLSIP